MKKFLSVMLAILVMVGVMAVPISSSAKSKPGKIQRNKGIVYTQKTVKYKNKDGKNTKFNIPAFNVNTKSAKKQNKQIKEYVMDNYNESKRNSRNKKVCFDESYKKYTDANLSYIVVNVTNSDGTTEVKSFCLDTSTGATKTKKQVLSYTGYSFQSLTDELKVDLYSYYEELPIDDETMDEFFEGLLKMDNVEIYVNNKGKVCVDINDFFGSTISFKMDKVQ
jgi:hypothetical protein